MGLNWLERLYKQSPINKVADSLVGLKVGDKVKTKEGTAHEEGTVTRVMGNQIKVLLDKGYEVEYNSDQLEVVATVVKAEAPAVPKPESDPGSGKKWVWNSTSQVWEAIDATSTETYEVKKETKLEEAQKEIVEKHLIGVTEVVKLGIDNRHPGIENGPLPSDIPEEVGGGYEIGDTYKIVQNGKELEGKIIDVGNGVYTVQWSDGLITEEDSISPMGSRKVKAEEIPVILSITISEESDPANLNGKKVTDVNEMKEILSGVLEGFAEIQGKDVRVTLSDLTGKQVKVGDEIVTVANLKVKAGGEDFFNPIEELGPYTINLREVRENAPGESYCQLVAIDNTDDEAIIWGPEVGTVGTSKYNRELQLFKRKVQKAIDKRPAEVKKEETVVKKAWSFDDVWEEIQKQEISWTTQDEATDKKIRDILFQFGFGPEDVPEFDDYLVLKFEDLNLMEKEEKKSTLKLSSRWTNQLNSWTITKSAKGTYPVRVTFKDETTIDGYVHNIDMLELMTDREDVKEEDVVRIESRAYLEESLALTEFSKRITEGMLVDEAITSMAEVLLKDYPEVGQGVDYWVGVVKDALKKISKGNKDNEIIMGQYEKGSKDDAAIEELAKSLLPIGFDLAYWKDRVGNVIKGSKKVALVGSYIIEFTDEETALEAAKILDRADQPYTGVGITSDTGNDCIHFETRQDAQDAKSVLDSEGMSGVTVKHADKKAAEQYNWGRYVNTTESFYVRDEKGNTKFISKNNLPETTISRLKEDPNMWVGFDSPIEVKSEKVIETNVDDFNYEIGQRVSVLMDDGSEKRGKIINLDSGPNPRSGQIEYEDGTDEWVDLMKVNAKKASIESEIEEAKKYVIENFDKKTPNEIINFIIDNYSVDATEAQRIYDNISVDKESTKKADLTSKLVKKVLDANEQTNPEGHEGKVIGYDLFIEIVGDNKEAEKEVEKQLKEKGFKLSSTKKLNVKASLFSKEDLMKESKSEPKAQEKKYGPVEKISSTNKGSLIGIGRQYPGLLAEMAQYAFTNIVNVDKPMLATGAKFDNKVSMSDIAVDVNKEASVISSATLFYKDKIITAYFDRYDGFVVGTYGKTEEICREFIGRLEEDMFKKNQYRGKCLYAVNNNLAFSDIPKVEWDDVILDEKVKKDIRLNTVAFLGDKKLIAAGVTKRGLIMYGPPGTGKTSIVKAVFSELKDKEVSRVYVTAESFRKMDVGNLFSILPYLGPTVLAFEDIDMISGSRDELSLGSTGLLGDLLTNLDGMRSYKDPVVVMASTNKINLLDAALANRPCRFDRRVEFGLPTAENLKKIYSKLVDGEITEEIITMSKGFTGSHCKEVINTSKILSVSQGKKVIDCLKDAVTIIRENFFPSQEVIELKARLYSSLIKKGLVKES